MSDRLKGRLGLFLVAIIWGGGFVFSSISLEYFTPYQILAVRFLLAFILMAVIFRKHLKNIGKETIKKGAIIGVFLYFAFMFQTIGLKYTTPSKNAFLTAANVVLVPFLTAIIYRRRLNRNSVIGAVLSLAGIAVMSLNEFGRINKGDWLTLICAVFFALQIMYTNEYVEDENIYALNTIQMGTASVLGIVVALFAGEGIQAVDGRGIMSVIYLGAISTMLAFLLQTASQRYTTGTEAAIILSTESVFGMIFSAIILKEQITTRMLIGAAMILAGVLIVEVKNE